jgi:hypothetical protein
MGSHGRTPRHRRWMALTSGIIILGAIVAGGTAHAAEDTPVAGTPCTEEARACVDLAKHQAWLLDEGTIVRGPVPISSGSPAKPTPRGDFAVQWKNINHRSAEFDNAPMPFAVFFADGGIAFHEGNVGRPSAGCVRLRRDDASAFYNYLEIDDPVQIR